MTYRYIYKITCTAGSFKDKFYFGQHTTTNLDDGYKGSGKKINDYYTKHSKEYIKEIISYHNSQEELNQAEYDIIKEWLGNPMCLNLRDGGMQGIFTEESRAKMSNSAKGKIISEITKEKMSIAHHRYTDEIKEKLRYVSSNNITKYNKSEQHKQATIESNKKRWLNGVSETTRINMQNAQQKYWKERGKVVWVHNTEHSKQIKIDELDKYLSNGYIKGRGKSPWNTKRKK